MAKIYREHVEELNNKDVDTSVFRLRQNKIG